MIAHLFDPKDSIYIIGFLATFKLACHIDRIHEGETVWLVFHYVNETHANALNSRTCADGKSSTIAALVRNGDNRSRKLLRSYQELENHLLKMFDRDQTIAE